MLKLMLSRGPANALPKQALLAFFGLLTGCGDSDRHPDTDATAIEVLDSLEDEGETTPDPVLCEEITQRLTDCGLSTSFPDFGTECLSFSATETETLRNCRVFACARLMDCASQLTAD